MNLEDLPNKYTIKLNDDNDFDLFVNGVKTITATFVGGLLVAIAAREGVPVHLKGSSESYILAVLKEDGINIEVDGW